MKSELDKPIESVGIQEHIAIQDQDESICQDNEEQK